MVDGNGYGVGGSHGGYGGGNVQSNFTNGWCLQVNFTVGIILASK
jgi:hypothetical protein